MADNLVSNSDDMLSEQEHLCQSLNLKNSIIYHAISINILHSCRTVTLIQKNKCYVILPYYGELSEKMKFFKDYDIYTVYTS